MNPGRLLIVAAALLAAFQVSAGAAEPTSPVAKAMSISVQTSVTFTGSTASVADQVALQSQARAQLYKIAGSECVAISAALDVECQLGQIQVSSRTSSARAGQSGGIVADGRFTFLIAPRQ